jgi:hypothetical protein
MLKGLLHQFEFDHKWYGWIDHTVVRRITADIIKIFLLDL